jgi:biotin carboxylase
MDQYGSERDLYIASLAGKSIVFISPGYEGKRFILEKAHELGINSIVVDSYGSWTNSLLHGGIIHHLIEVDMSLPDDEVFETCISRLCSLGIELNGICTFVELSAPLTARLCDHFKLPGHSMSSVALARDKHSTRKAISSCPSTAEFAIRNHLLTTGSEEDLAQAADYVRFPAVLKPVAGAASLGVQKVTSMNELRETYQSVSEIVSELIVANGALDRRVQMVSDQQTSETGSTVSDNVETPVASGDVPRFISNVSSLSNTSVVMEEYLDGQEVDIDIVLWDKQITFCEISDNGPTMEPYFGETWNNCPSLLPESAQAQLRQMAASIVIDALGFVSGVFHVEAKYTSAGEPRLIEVNCRMGGGPIRTVHLCRSQVDLVVEQLLLSVGLPAIPPSAGETKPCIGFIDVNARKCGSVNSTDFLKNIAQMSNMVYCKPLVAPGQHIVGPEEGQPSWLAEAVFTESSPEEASKNALKLYEEIQKLFESHYI